MKITFLSEYPVYAINNRTMFFASERFCLGFWNLLRKRGYGV